MEIGMQDIFYGFVRSYHSFRLQYRPPWTNWTRKMLGHFDRLGTLLGAKVEYELNKYDLSWFRKGKDEIWFHIEHENAPGWESLKDTIRKINESDCDNMVVIVYPKNQELWDKFVNKIEGSQKNWTKTFQILAILDASEFEDQPTRLNGYLFSNLNQNEVYKAIKYEEKTTEIQYAVIID